MNPLNHVRRLLTPPYSLNRTILFAASAVVVLLFAVYSAVAYDRMARDTMASAQKWSDSVALLASTANTSALILNDVAAIESNLQQLVVLPGIESIAVFRPDGRVLTEAHVAASGVASSVGGSERMAVPAAGTKTLPSQLQGQVYESWAAMDTGAASPSAWIRVHFSLKQRADELTQLWRQALWVVVAMVGLLLLGLQFVVAWAVKPVRNLSDFAKTMPTALGQEFDLKKGCIEVNQLGEALNSASRNIAEQLGRIQAIVNTATEAIVGLDAKGNISTLNPAASSFFGRPEEELLAFPFSQCVPGLTEQELFDMFDNQNSYFSRMSRILRKDFFGTRADGTLFPVEISLGQVQNNKELRYVCILRDVTDERAALEFTELYERALACSHNAVFITKAQAANHPVVYVNDAFQKITGLRLHEILGGSMDTLLGVTPTDPAYHELNGAVSEQRIANVSISKNMPDGTQRIMELSLSPVSSDKGVLTHFVGIVSDVSARVRAEEAMAERRAQLDAIFSLSPDGFVLFDRNDHLVFANPAFERMTGLGLSDRTQAITLDAFESVMTEVCDPSHPFPSLRDQAQHDEPWHARLQFARPQVRVVQAQSRRNIAGRSETILYFRDVTHEDAVDRMKSEFLAAAAHELRTPMVSIFGFTELLLKRKFTEERKTDMLETIHRQSGLLVKMINELLDLARIESRGGLDLKIDAYALTELIQTSVKGLMRADTDRQVEVAAVPDVQVLIDPEKMQLAMNNLLSNAFKYSPQGGAVTLQARIEKKGNEPYAVIEIRDQGIGMTTEQLDRAFERFYRADASGNIPGTGLGLSLVKEVAELHKGRIELRSEYGQGTTACLWIPITKSNASRPAQKALVADPVSVS
jgi:PAS domain S-box-containing protein